MMQQVIVSHAGADFDAYASMVAAQRLYPEAVLVTLGRPAPLVREFLSLHQGQFPVLPSKQIDPLTVGLLVVVDTSNPQRLGQFRMLAQQSGVEVHIYDHHPPTAESIHGEVSHIKMLGAAVTVVLEEVRRRDPAVKLSVSEATLFLIAIYEETGCLSYSSTTPTDLRTAAWLLEQGAKLAVVREVMQQGLSEEQRHLRDLLLAGARRVPVDGARALLLTGATSKYVGELNEVVSRLLQQEEVDLVLAAVRMGERTYVVGRARHPRYNLLPAFRPLGGGGHPGAASAALGNDTSPEDLLLQMLPHLHFGGGSEELVRDFMTDQVHTIELESCTVGEAAERLLSLGKNATVITDHGRVVGMLARSDLDKALRHGLADMPAQSVMTQPVLAVTPETTLEDARQVLVSNDVGRLPVLEDGTLKGIISRTDVLRHLYDTRRLGSVEVDETQKPSQQLLRLPWRWLELLKQSGQVARKCGVEVFAVGGFVRDLILERLHQSKWDLDLCVEGSVDEFIRELSSLWGASVHTHPRFETATLVLPDGQKVDVARARQESYVRPAALPEVQSSNLKQDLFRRDFTINALALRLTEGGFGELIDFFGGQNDLRNQTIRVLHNHSFIDDPTRMLRAVRLEQRLGFHLSDTCEHLLRAAVQQGIVALAGPNRLRDELILCLSEADPVAVLDRLNKLKILAAIHADLTFEVRVKRLLQLTLQAYRSLSDWVDATLWKVLVRAWLYRWKDEAVAVLIDHFRFHLERSRSPLNLSSVLYRLNREGLPPSRIHQLLSPLLDEELVLLWALNQDSKGDHQRIQSRILAYVQNLRDVEPLLTGREILAAGVPQGPAVARYKAEALAEQIDQGWTERSQVLDWLSKRLQNQ